MGILTPNGSEELPWYCIQLLLDTIGELSPLSANQGRAEQSHRLCLMMVSTVSSLSVPLMLRCLDHIRDLNNAYSTLLSNSGVDEITSKTRKMELLEAFFSELLENTDERQKGPAMRWWYTNRPTLISESVVDARLLSSQHQEEGAKDVHEPNPVTKSRL